MATVTRERFADNELCIEWYDAVAAIAGCPPGAPPAEAIERLIACGDALAAALAAPPADFATKLDALAEKWDRVFWRNLNDPLADDRYVSRKQAQEFRDELAEVRAMLAAQAPPASDPPGLGCESPSNCDPKLDLCTRCQARTAPNGLTPPSWLVVRFTDQTGPQAWEFASEQDARAFYASAHEQWSECYLTRVVQAGSRVLAARQSDPPGPMCPDDRCGCEYDAWGAQMRWCAKHPKAPRTPTAVERMADRLTAHASPASDPPGQDDVTFWQMVADGVNHDPRCPNHFAGDPEGQPCMRCQLEAARQSDPPGLVALVLEVRAAEAAASVASQARRDSIDIGGRPSDEADEADSGAQRRLRAAIADLNAYPLPASPQAETTKGDE